MKTYKIKTIYRYTSILEVDAETEEEAMTIALDDSPEYEALVDQNVLSVSEAPNAV